MNSTLDTPRGRIAIRLVRISEVAAFRDLRLEALRTHPEAFAADYASDLARPIEFWQERVRNNMGDDQGAIFVAEANGTLAGMVGVRRHEGVKVHHGAMLWGVYVRPEWRGMDLAQALIAACLGWARTAGLRQVRLGVATTNGAAIRSYVESGFQVYGLEEEAIYSNGAYYDELLMARCLVDDKPI